MPILSNTNRNPYFDDYDSSKNFHRVEFKPGYPVQARELTQLQTIINDQFEQLSGKFFKNGDTIIPGDYSLGIPVAYVRVSSITQGSRASDYIGYTLRGVVSGVEAVVTYAEDATDEDDTTFFVNYISSGDDKVEVSFTEGETLESDTPNFFTAVVGVSETSKPVNTKPMGFGSLVTVNEGSYYVNGFMVRNREQTISLDKYSTKPTCEVGFIVDEDFITSNEDPSLLDNAQGHSNFAAPGADRLRITLILSKRQEDTELPNFISLINILQGNIIGSPSQNVKWDWLYDLLAKRTYDESGDYTVTEFPIDLLEYWNSEIVDGVFDPEPDKYGDETPYPPVPQTGERLPLSFEDADENYSIEVSPGSAYVQGYHVGYKSPFYVYGKKPRNLEFIDDTYTQINPGIFVKVSNVYGSPDFVNGDEDVVTRAFDSIITYRSFIDGHTGASFSGSEYEGTSRPLNVGEEPWVTYHILTDKPIGRLTLSSTDRNNGKSVKVGINGQDYTVVYPVSILDFGSTQEGRILTEIDSIIVTEAGDAILKDTVAEPNSTVSAQYSIVIHAADGEIIRGDNIGNEGARATVVMKIHPSKSGVIDPKYFYSDSLVTDKIDNNKPGSSFKFNSSFNLGILSSEYFTEFVVIENDETEIPEWKASIGKLIFGQESRSSAKIEDYFKGKLTVSNINGQFIEGEVLNVENPEPAEPVDQGFLFNEVGQYILQENEGKIELDFSTTGTSTSARLLRSGEVVDIHFNGIYANNENGNGGDGGGGGGDSSNGGSGSSDGSGAGGNTINIEINQNSKDVYTRNVILTNPTSSRSGGIDLPDEFGFETQEGANYWFYTAIKSIVFGEDANNIHLSPNPPENPAKEDLWVDESDYVTYIWDGNYWIGITAPDEAGIDPDLLPKNSRSISTVSLRDSLFDLEGQSPFVDGESTGPSDPLSLAEESYITFLGVGSDLTLYRELRDRNGIKKPDYTYDSVTNSIKLTEEGRERIFKYAFFNPEQAIVTPRINYEIITQNGIRGYAVTSPAKITNTLKKTKSFYSDLADENNFTSEIALDNALGGDVYSVANNSTFTGTSGRNFVVCDNYKGDASEDLIAGDVVAITNDTGYVQYKVVLFATVPFGYAKSNTKSTIYFTTTLEGSVTSKQVQRLRLKSHGDTTESLIYQLPVSVVHSLETDPNNTEIEYQVFRQFAGTLEKNQSTISFTTVKSDEYFVSDPLKTTIVVSKVELGDTPVQENLEGRILQLAQVDPIEIQDGGRKIIYKLSGPLPETAIIKAICPVRVKNGHSKIKTLNRDVSVTIFYSDMDIYDPLRSPATQRVISLGYADVFRVNSVMMGTKDVTDDYIFDDGQRDTYYDISRLVRKSGRSLPTENLVVNFDYFEHISSVGSDFFSVDSYLHNRDISYADIPVYRPSSVAPTGSMTAENGNLSIKLRDCVDFRPIVNTIGPNASFTPILSPSRLTEESTNYDTLKVNGNAHVPRIPIPSTQFKSDIEFYLPKIDTLFLDKTGKMIIKEGEPSKNPVAPPDLATGIRLYDLHMPAYTFNVNDIVVRKYNHKRYTMKDIMDIDKRVNRVERLVSLSLLEQSALNMSVRDAVTGLDRFKNGIVVDTFKDHSKGDVGSDQYRCSIDPKESHLRPSYVVDQVRLEEKFQTQEEVDKFGSYRKNNGIITCDYEDVGFISQPVATRSHKLQLNTSSIAEGNIIMSPAMDTFYDTSTLPKLVVNNNNLYDAMLNLTKDQVESSMGTVWSEWETGGRLPNDRVNQLGREGTNTPIQNQKITNFFTAGSVRIASSSSAAQQARNDFHLSSDVSTGIVQSTSFGDRMVDIQLSKTMRSIPVYIKAERLKPNTRYFAFFDNINVSQWFCVDNLEDDYSDGRLRYAGSPNDNPKGFDLPIVSDSEGNVTGVFIIPNGRPPVSESTFTGRMDDLEYQTSGNTRTFSVGQKSFKLVSSPNPAANLTEITGYAKADFVSRPVIMDKQDTIVSTRLPEQTTNTTLRDDVRLNYDGDGTEYDPTGAPSPVPTPYDPIAQTFRVDRNNPNGVFVTDLDLFFREKDMVQGVEAYLVSTEAGIPTTTILPHSRVVMSSDSIVRVQCELHPLVQQTSLLAGTVVKGQKSGATGVMKSAVDFQSSTINSSKNVSNTVYNIVLDNYLNEFIPGEEIVPDVRPANRSTFTIVENEITVSRVDLVSMGQNYNSGSVVEIGAPELPGGVRATAELRVAENLDGEVYEVVLTSSGSGYTKAPGVSIIGRGDKAEAKCRIVPGRKSVTMGVATSDDSTAPTKFRFHAPVYLQGNSTYAFVVKSPTSMKYSLWTCKLGENKIGTASRVVEQPNTGVVFTSQNEGVWTEDQSLDITFILRRAEFKTGLIAQLDLQNSPLQTRVIQKNPIGTNFYSDPSKVLVYHYNHGFSPGDFVIIEGVTDTPGGIPNRDINGIHKVIDCDLDDFTIAVTTNVTPRTSKGGGDSVRCTYNRPYEAVNLYSGAMSFPSTLLTATNRGTEFAGVRSLLSDGSVGQYNKSNEYRLDSEVDVPLMDTYYYTGTKQVAHYTNEILYKDDLHLNGRKSMETMITIGTQDSKVSPVIDLDRTNMTVIRNMVDNPTDGTKLDSRIKSTSVDDTFYRNETFNNGSVFSKWISKMFVFENQCDGVEVRLASIFYDVSDIKVYFKLRTAGFDGDFSKVNWIPFNPSQVKPRETRKVDGSYVRTPGLPDSVDVIKPRNSINVDPKQILADEWQELTWTAQDLSKFDGVAIKIVMTASNPALSPLIDDFSLIVSE